MLREALQHGVRWQFIASNPADAATPPRPERKEMRALAAGEVRTLLEACEDDQMRTLIFTAVTTGMRLGELLGLRWSDLDLASGSAHVSRSAQYLPETGVTFGTTKTARSRRSVALSPKSVSALLGHRKRQIEARLAIGPEYADGNLVFARVEGQPFAPHSISRVFRSLAKRAALQPLRFHDLRHTAATLMLLADVHPKVVSERLGHASVSITLDTYSHVLPDMQSEAAVAIDRVLDTQT